MVAVTRYPEAIEAQNQVLHPLRSAEGELRFHATHWNHTMQSGWLPAPGLWSRETTSPSVQWQLSSTRA